MTDLSGSPPADPLPILSEWLERAAGLTDRANPHSLVLSTTGANGRADARVVLLKHYDDKLGFLVFYTNYLSAKGRQLAACPEASAVFHWDRLGLQARVRGPVVISPAAESDAYFATRGWKSQLAAWASDQSRPASSRADLEARMNEAAARFGGDAVRLDQGALRREPSRGRRTGAATAFGRALWNYGRRVKRACMTGSAGRASWNRPAKANFMLAPGAPAAFSPDRRPRKLAWNNCEYCLRWRMALPGVCVPVGADDPALTAEPSPMDGFMRLPEGPCANASAPPLQDLM